MKQIIIALILISLCVIDLYVIGYYRVVQALYDVNEPIAVLLLAGVALSVGVTGFCMLVGGE